MRELSLFSGAGGGLLGTKLLGWEHIGYVEYNEYCQKVIQARIDDGYLDKAPIFGDIRAFLSEGYAESYKGLVDVVTAGFPCQPFSVAGKGEGENDERNMWPQTLDTIRLVRPRYAMLENVPGLFNHRYIQRIFGDLAEVGYDCRWRVISARDCGAPHLRKRIWILCTDSSSDGCIQYHSIKEGHEPVRRGPALGESDSLCASVPNTGCEHWKERNAGGLEANKEVGRKSSIPPKSSCERYDASNPASIGSSGSRRAGHPRSSKKKGKGEINRTVHDGQWPAEPNVGRMAHGVPFGVDRLTALGNGQVPIVAATAWEILNQ